MEGCTVGRMDGRMDGWKGVQLEGWMDGRMDGWKGVQLEGWVDGRVYSWKDGVPLQLLHPRTNCFSIPGTQREESMN